LGITIVQLEDCLNTAEAERIERDITLSRTTEALRHRKAMEMKLGHPTERAKANSTDTQLKSKLCFQTKTSQRFITEFTKQPKRIFATV
jgi:hypothetical protein